MPLIMAGVFLSIGVIDAAAKTKTILVRKTGGGPDGYNTVDEQHYRYADKSEEHFLACNDPGHDECKWENDPGPLLVSYAENQIALGNLSGSYWQMFGPVMVTVEWNAGDVYNAEIEEGQVDPLN